MTCCFGFINKFMVFVHLNSESYHHPRSGVPLFFEVYCHPGGLSGVLSFNTVEQIEEYLLQYYRITLTFKFIIILPVEYKIEFLIIFQAVKIDRILDGRQDIEPDLFSVFEADASC